MLSRRELVGKLAACSAALVAVAAARPSSASVQGHPGLPTTSGSSEDPVPPIDEVAARDVNAVDAGPATTLSAVPPMEILRPLAIGSAVASGWHIAALSGVVDGSSVLSLQNEKGRVQRVHLCRNDGRPQGLVHTERFDLVVMNGGCGDLPTEEGFAQAVAEVAHVLAANERNSGNSRVAMALLPHAERMRLFSGPADRRLR